MGTIADKLTYLNTTKQNLKDSINNLGGNITSETTFRNYANVLNNIFDSLPKISGKDSILNLSPTLKGRLISTIYGNTIQNGTPTPSSPVPIQNVTRLQKINVTGKNLFNKDSVITGKYYSATGALTDFKNGFGELIEVKENTIYSLKITNNYSSTIRLMAFVYDSTMTRLAQIRWGDSLASNSNYTNQNYTMPSSSKYIGISVLDLSPTIENINLIPIQLEQGSTATEYEPYQGQEYDINLGTLELNKIGDYQDYISGTPNNWVINRQIGKVVLNGASGESWTYNSSKLAFYHALSDNLQQNIQSNEICISNKLENKGITLWNDTTGTIEYGFLINNQYLYIRNSNYTDATNFKTWLSSNNVTVIYPLATPTTETITNTELINQLNALYNATSYDGTTNIIVSGDLAAILSASALKGE